MPEFTGQKDSRKEAIELKHRVGFSATILPKLESNRISLERFEETYDKVFKL